MLKEWKNSLSKQKGMFAVNKNRINKGQKAAEVHRANLQKNLEHRLEVARANGDEALIRQLQQEASYLQLN